MASQPERENELTRLRRENARLEAELARRVLDDAALAASRADLSASERRLRDTLESIDEGFLLIDRDWRVIDLNLRAVRMDGRSAARLVGRTIFELWPEAGSPEIDAVFRRSMAGRRPARLLHRHVSQGTERWLDLRLFPSGQGLALFFRDVTAQRVAEQRLHQAEVNARLALDAARLGTWAFEPRTGRVVWDDQYRAIMGLAPGAPIDLAMVIASIHPDDRARLNAALQAASDPAGSGEIVQEYRVTRASDGQERWITIIGRALFEGGVCIRFDGVVQDITERKRIAASLARSEAGFRAIAEVTPAIVFVTDPDGMNTYVNPQYAAFTGMPPSALLGDGWLAAVHPDDLARAKETWWSAVRSGAEYEVEHRFRRHDGVYRWFLCRGRPLRGPGLTADEGNSILQWFGTAIDIQEQVEARQVLARDRDALERLVTERTQTLLATLDRLRTEEARLRALFHNSSECLFLIRIEPERGPVYSDLNPAAAALLGLGREQVIGRTPRELLDDPADIEDSYRQLEGVPPAGKGAHRYTARRRFGAREVVLDMVAVALSGPQGERLILLSGRDVTEQRALEETLRQSQKMEAIGQLTGGIAHDFNNLLTGIAGSIEIMRGRAAQGRVVEMERHAAAAMESVRRAASLTHRLLAFARRQALDPKPADINRLVAGMEELITRAVGTGVRVEMALAAGLWPVLCDANQLENALLNLCLNARDAMPEGGVLRIETGNVAEGRLGGEAVAIVVSDTGVGMTEEVASRAFEPFFTTKPIGQGTGLGLSMLYGFVRQSGGRVELHSEPGRGTTVRIELPRCAAEALADDGEPAGGAASGGARGRAILLVEDEDVVRELAVEVLREQGYRVLEAADGRAAMRILDNDEPIDLLLTDVGLPGMSGRDLALAARGRRPGLKVLFITGYAHQASGWEGLKGPGMDLLGKPFRLDALTDKVAAVLGR